MREKVQSFNYRANHEFTIAQSLTLSGDNQGADFYLQRYTENQAAANEEYQALQQAEERVIEEMQEEIVRQQQPALPPTSAPPAPTSQQQQAGNQWPDGQKLQSPEKYSICRLKDVPTGDTLHLRQGPGANYPIVTDNPPTASNVTVYVADWEKNASDIWFPVSWQNYKGYLRQKFLCPQ
jgi:hypothetical protein